MKSVYFMKSCPPYNSGERAGFEPKIADALIADGTAISYSDYLDKQARPTKAPARKPAKRAVRKKSKK